jgi:hypothetical protein
MDMKKYPHMKEYSQKWEKDGQIIECCGVINFRDDVTRIETEQVKRNGELEMLKYGWRFISEK